MKKLRQLKKLELVVGIGFSLIGFFIGSLLIGNTLNSKIQLDSPKEISDNDSRPYLSEKSPDIEIPNVPNPQVENVKQLRKKEKQTASTSPSNKFTSLSQEEKNCVIWKNAYPEAAYKLKQGDACY
ncbi:hypothetical protein SynSYN20_02210 [Synechococcus sp. SYN20]|uniref:hypothetical protein n=1 Tax=Synechococcus sp. SYN20 TaxID=1050714 RepID=UPI001645AF35|nr:hypothetical protein [Synechococcus sp. SYN20]QNJ26532.1 hypothetical protein SynSYN20_02210 [Synechococcus sp. SYN20]